MNWGYQPRVKKESWQLCHGGGNFTITDMSLTVFEQN